MSLTRVINVLKKDLLILKKVLKATDLIIIDEISMVSTDLLDMIAYRLNNYGYLGKVLFVGDFFQLPPVQKHNGSSDVFGEKLYAFESMAWDRFDLMVIELTEMKRTTDAEFTHILSKVRKGICDDEVIDLYDKTLEYMKRWKKNLPICMDVIWKLNKPTEPRSMNLIRKRPYSLPILRCLGVYMRKKLSGWKNMLPISEQLTLKEGVPILFTVNKWGKFVNGERGILKKIEDDHLIVEKEEEYVRVERHEFDLVDMLVKEDGTVETISLPHSHSSRLNSPMQ